MDGKCKRLLTAILFIVPISTFANLPLYESQHQVEPQRDHLLNQFYQNKVHKPAEAEKALIELLKHHPDDVHALKEMGYWKLYQKRPAEALAYFQRASILSPNDYALHSQLGYLYDDLGKERDAYYEFEKASQSPDPKLQQQSREAMIALGGTQLQILPNPYFADLYVAPSYYSRFHDFILPYEMRAGALFGENEETKVYTIAQGNYDSQSKPGEVPIIYFDNYVMVGGGFEFHPIKALPVYTFVETGAAYEIILEVGEKRWQNDTRVGFYTYLDWGANAGYYSEPTWSLKPVGDFYGVFEYYSRYDHNWIGQFRGRQGIRAFQHENSSVDLYLKLELFADTKQIYYNNMIQGGPGIVWTPDNRWPVQMRLEGMKGMYIPTPDESQNPFPRHYNTIFAEIAVYFNI